jgi:hypothetical protein
MAMLKEALKMAAGRARVIAVAAVVALSSAGLAACGGGGSTATTGASGASGAAGAGQVSATDYVSSVCSAVGDFRTTIMNEQASAQQAITTSGNDLGAIKEQLSKFISSVAGASQQLATEVKGAGTPDVPNGDQLASKLNDGLDQIATEFQAAEKKVNSLPTSSQQAFTTAAQSFDADIQQETAQLQSEFAATSGASPELKQAAQQNPDCKALQSG